MKTQYYLGWMSNFLPEPLANVLQEDLTDRKSLVMISANPSSDEADGAAERSWLHQAGIGFEESHLINYSVQKEEAHTLLQRASVIFLLGGNTIEQNEFLMDYELPGLIRKSSAVVIGASAGAINMSAKWLASRNFGYDIEKNTLYEGIGLNNFSVLSHFDLENNMALVRDELSLLSEEMAVYASNKDCAVRVTGNKIDIFGDVYLISRSEIQKLDETL
ncbi:Type 1 glutamine amidotransferase-like domain-containing protein [Planococcus sp. CAU13]|uniref:Type 1 glutamine amidotransferase-like domain-containing protein n=1 Tax=Planococcus sp. CAU13 TaxID=1541197 RepID=UPI00052FEA05|nr:Type 1 glutamine amidotransferase-like domain-containing protein [Planococcus sp. CAU13]